MRAPTEVSLPVDPLDTLSQRWELSKLDIFEERWVVEEVDALPYLRRRIAPPRGAGITDAVWQSDDDG